MNKKTFFRFLFFSLMTSILLVSCEDNDSISYSETKVTVTLPDIMEGQNVKPDGLTVKFTNQSSGQVTSYTTDANGLVTENLEYGLYNIEVSGNKTYGYQFNETEEQVTQTSKLIGLAENVTISNSTTTIGIDLSIEVESKGWVIKEIYYAGSKTPMGNTYSKDQFVEIYNNTNSVLYADGISLAQTINLTTNKTNEYAAQINQSTYVNTLYTIPGSGKDYPVSPGKSILIAPQPINHKELNANSFDLSISDFQWYDAHATLSIDVPEVPNLIKYYSYSATIWLLQVKGNRSILIFKASDMPNYYAQNSDTRPNSVGTSVTSVKVDNNLILDAVELATKDQLYTKSLAASVDLGYTYCDDSYSAKSVRRKVERIEEGRVIYKDTNNSLEDFIPNATPQPKIFK